MSKETREVSRRLKREQMRLGLCPVTKWEDKKFYNMMRVKSRHEKGVHKKYNTGITKLEGYNAWARKKRRTLERGGGALATKTIQTVYEDNIKKYGTLTCYLCLETIEFGKDTLEHKIPFTRNGTNEYTNLAIACKSCNSKKHNKTEEEYREKLQNFRLLESPV
jgi:5-methylcytosine-specific restriction endonuclease McrA